MKPRPLVVTLVMIIAMLIAPACNLIPSHFEIETTSELGPDTLARIDDVNDVLERGVEIGPETRATIEELNQTVRDGIKFGFTEDSLARVDRMLDLVEQGVGLKVGLDSETNATVNSLIDTIDDMPDQWEGTVTDIIETLEGSSSRVASQMADEVRGLMDEARLNTQYVTAAVGTEFRCNVDFLGARAGDTVNQFIGRTLIGRLRSITSGETEEVEETPVPWVCQIIPDQIDLVEAGDRFVFETAVIKISGYNYVEANKPTAYFVDEAGQKLEAVPLYPFLSSPYQLQLNLQDIDFSAIPQRSRVVFEWLSAGTNYGLAVVFPTDIPETPIVQAELTVSAAAIDVRKGPAETYNVIGRAESGAKYVVLGSNGDASWWQIDYDGEDGWVPASAVSRNEVAAPVVSIPLPPPVADFQMDKTTGNAPLEVHFLDRSTGSPIRWEWSFGEGMPLFEQNPVHTFETAGTYLITLDFESDDGFSSVTKSIEVTQPPMVHIIPPIHILPFVPAAPTPTPAFPSGSMVFTNVTALGDSPNYDTGFSTSAYDCGLVGYAALDGDIQEHGVGNPVRAQMVDYTGTWHIIADFRTHNDHESWSFAILCQNKAYAGGYEFHRSVPVTPGDAVDLTTLDTPINILPERYCGVVGMAAWDGDIEESGSGEHIIKTYVQKNSSSGNWEAVADFRTQGTEETWTLDLLCVYDNPAVFLHKEFTAMPGGTAFDTSVRSADYACGIAGMAGLHGDIDADGSGRIMRVYPFIGTNGNWWVMADFRSSGVHEVWDIDLLCASRSAATLQGSWTGEWAR
jgi:PKD repeat protein